MKNKGMIIIGYPGIGKSTLAKEMDNVIDLESSNFVIYGSRMENWQGPYCRIAADIASQGYIVMVSSHSIIQNWLQMIKYSESDKYTIVIICPSLRLRNYWITRMKYRWEETNEEKDRKAYKHVSNNFINDIKSLTNETGFTTIRLQTMDYELKPIVEFLYNAQL